MSGLRDTISSGVYLDLDLGSGRRIISASSALGTVYPWCDCGQVRA
jgi:hypothetical protein